MGLRKTVMKSKAVSGASRVANRQGKKLSRSVEGVMERVRPRRKKNVLGMTAVKGLGAAAVAVPVGLWLGNRRRQSEQL